LTVALPRLPDRALLADLCREAAARERVQPQLIEKDFYLTRILWALGQSLGDGLLLKGGTLLSKVDLGFFRLSEDADLVLAGPPSRQKVTNVRRMHQIRDVLKEIGPVVGVSAHFPAGELFDKATHCVWQLDYPSEFGPQGIRLEVSIRPVLRPPREVGLRQLITDPLAGDGRAAKCFALDAAEARAEKVRAAFTREAVRDFYDLDRLYKSGADMSSPAFLKLVDAKLAELGGPPMSEQEKSFGLTEKRRRQVEAGLVRDLPAVLRTDAPEFDLDAMLAQFDRLWRQVLLK
jgi:predicted nucleotidyltransferase component of viral defense system